jgi:hypothetical protein
MRKPRETTKDAEVDEGTQNLEVQGKPITAAQNTETGTSHAK